VGVERTTFMFFDQNFGRLKLVYSVFIPAAILGLFQLTNNRTNINITMPTASSHREILLISYEFTYGTFSGNGILARSLVKSLLHNGCTVTVWCCRPPSDDTADDDDNDFDNSGNNNNNNIHGRDHHLQVPELEQHHVDRLKLIPITISSSQKWHRLDDASAFTEFVWDKLSKQQQQSMKDVVQHAQAVLYIDWTGHHAWTSTPFSQQQMQHPPLTYLNFRVFSNGVSDVNKRAWYDEREIRALREASLVVALSQKDKDSLRSTYKPEGKDIHVLVPPLRGDVEDFALQHMRSDNPEAIFLEHMPPEALKAIQTNNKPKIFITCVVRLSPEKNTMRFVHFLGATKEFWSHRNWVPLLAGSSSDPDYARQVKEELEKVCGKENCIILDKFLPPSSLVAVFSRAVFNFHPCAYDAYGMTIMEAAALGVPSIIASGGHVGASVHVGNGASIEVEMEHNHDDSMTHDAISQVLSTLQNAPQLEAIGKEAQKRALAWDEDAYGKALLELLAA
jgi:glycosyltransferase involved in cell wall biosynthesis